MEDQGKNTTFAVVESLSGWWELAGVDSAVQEKTLDLLERDAVVSSPTMPTLSNTEKKQAELPVATAIIWPSDIATLRVMVANGAPLPGNAYAPIRFPPIGPDSCDVMVISDLPDILGPVIIIIC